MGSRAEKNTQDLLFFIEKLIEDYGRIATLLAVKADFTESSDERVLLYSEAYCMAEEKEDKVNMELILESIKEMVSDGYVFENDSVWGERIRAGTE